MRIKVRVTEHLQLIMTYHHGEPQNTTYHHGAVQSTNHHHDVLHQPDQVPPEQQNKNNTHVRGYEIALEIGPSFKVVIMQTGTETMQRNPIYKPPASQKIGEEVEAGQAGRKDGEQFHEPGQLASGMHLWIIVFCSTCHHPN